MTDNESRYDNSILFKYEKALDTFEDFLDDFSEMYEGRDSFKPMLDHLEGLRSIIESCHEILEDYDDDEADFNDLEDQLKEEIAESLEEELDNPPSVFPGETIAPLNDSSTEKLLDDLMAFADRYYEENISKKGYELYHVLIGAA